MAGTCTCDEDYYGVDCSKYCSPTQSCSGHGTCDKNGQCVCDPGNYGSQCTCNAQNCLNGGTCHASGAPSVSYLTAGMSAESLQFMIGVCNCAPTYFGPTCAVHCDASVSCHSHGNCSVSGCTCFVGWTGSDCSQRQV